MTLLKRKPESDCGNYPEDWEGDFIDDIADNPQGKKEWKKHIIVAVFFVVGVVVALVFVFG